MRKGQCNVGLLCWNTVPLLFWVFYYWCYSYSWLVICPINTPHSENRAWENKFHRRLNWKLELIIGQFKGSEGGLSVK